MSYTASITVLSAPEEVERLWRQDGYRPEHIDPAKTTVRFITAPGDRGTEIHVALTSGTPGGKLGQAVQKVKGTDPQAKVKDDLRRFKQLVETGVIAASDSVPEGELIERKTSQRPGQPLPEDELRQVGA
jgi:hypothetical protein